MFADQDDIWLPKKIAVSLLKMKKTELESTGSPVLIYSDLTVVDEKGIVMCDSFGRYQGLKHVDINVCEMLLVQNCVTGCSVIVNRAALRVIAPIPDGAILHDWWAALCVSSIGGKIGLIVEPLLKYRQHGRNTVGACSYWMSVLRGVGAMLRGGDEASLRFESTVFQAKALVTRLDSTSTELGLAHGKLYRAVYAYSKLDTVGRIAWLSFSMKFRFRRQTLLGQVAFFGPADCVQAAIAMSRESLHGG